MHRRIGWAETDSAESKFATPLIQPRIHQRKRVEDYGSHELDALAQWIPRNEIGCTDNAAFDALFWELGFKRRGWRISAVLRNSLELVRAEDVFKD